VTAALVLAGCGSSKNDTVSSGSTATKSAVPTQSQDTALHNKLPASIKSRGVVKVATDPSYAPNEFFGTDNKSIVGMDVDLGTSLGEVLGVKFTFVKTGFDGIIPSLGTRFDLGMSSFTDNKKREKIVDMVTYFIAGTSFLVAKGKDPGVKTLADLCGKSVGVEKGTVQLDDATAQSKKCTSGGKAAVKVQAFPDQAGANLALQSGRVQVDMADSPVLDYAAKQFNGQFEVVGQTYGTAPYGIAVPKTGSYAGFSASILTALRKLMANGTYLKVLTKWGVQHGAISNPTVNGATS
jgi:polar amino acid transport system substrate-binding protein